MLHAHAYYNVEQTRLKYHQILKT